jgi:hypothetical protein
MASVSVSVVSAAAGGGADGGVDAPVTINCEERFVGANRHFSHPTTFHCYAIYLDITRTWLDANFLCSAGGKGSHALTVSDASELDVVLTGLKIKSDHYGRFWLGGGRDPALPSNGEYVFSWVTGEAWTLSNACDGHSADCLWGIVDFNGSPPEQQPDGDGFCVRYRPEYGSWTTAGLDDYNCTEAFYSVCEWSPELDDQ